jgi:hypothetical protein
MTWRAAAVSAGLVGLAGAAWTATDDRAVGSPGGSSPPLMDGETAAAYLGCSIAFPERRATSADPPAVADEPLAASLTRADPRYTFAAADGRVTVAPRAGGGPGYDFPADERTAFAVVGHRLFVAGGGAVTAVDLTTGTELWRTPVGPAAGLAAGERDVRVAVDGVVVALGADTGERLE